MSVTESPYLVDVLESATDMLIFDDYQERARSLAMYPLPEDEMKRLLTLCNAMTAEMGEFCHLIVNLGREEWIGQDDVAGELGDVLWHLAALCSEFGIQLSVVARENIKKLESRRSG